MNRYAPSSKVIQTTFTARRALLRAPPPPPPPSTHPYTDSTAGAGAATWTQSPRDTGKLMLPLTKCAFASGNAQTHNLLHRFFVLQAPNGERGVLLIKPHSFVWHG
jgi:hypothetical protein